VVRTASRQAAALARARQRRIDLDRERDEQDKRVEVAAADVLMLIEARREAEQAIEATNLEIGEALQQLLAENVGVDRAAQLVELDAAEVRRLTRSQGAGSVPKVGPTGQATKASAVGAGGSAGSGSVG
jgi:hypothetical protein